MDHWKYTATAGDHIDTLILGDQPKWEDEEPPCKPFKMLGVWDGLTTVTIPLSMTNGALDMLANDQCPSLIRLEVDCVAPLHDSHIEGSEPDLRAPDSAAIGLLEALRRLSGHVPRLEQLHWPVEDEKTVSKLIRRADNAGATSITPSTSPAPFPRLHTLTIGPFVWPSLPAPAARQYPALLQPYVDQAAVVIESATWRKDEYEEFQACLYRRVALAMQTGVLTPPDIDCNTDSLMAQQEWQLQLLKRLSTVVGGRGELEELINRRVDDWLKWYEWYHSFSAWRESARKVAGHDVGTAGRTPGWKVLVG
jgi:hypothetical protein